MPGKQAPSTESEPLNRCPAGWNCSCWQWAAGAIAPHRQPPKGSPKVTRVSRPADSSALGTPRRCWRRRPITASGRQWPDGSPARGRGAVSHLRGTPAAGLTGTRHGFTPQPSPPDLSPQFLASAQDSAAAATGAREISGAGNRPRLERHGPQWSPCPGESSPGNFHLMQVDIIEPQNRHRKVT